MSELDTTAVRLRKLVAHLSRSLRSADAASGLTPTQASLLATVVRSGPVALSELARVEGLNATMLSRSLRALEEAGLVRKEPDPGDRRAFTADSTPAGRRLLRRLRDARNDVLRAQLAGLSENEVRLVERALPVLETVAERLKAGRVTAR